MSRLLHPFTPPAKDTGDFLNIVSGKGSVLTLKDGEILDGMGSLWYCNVGYGHPRSPRRSSRSSTRSTPITFSILHQRPRRDTRGRDRRSGTDARQQVFFAQSGSEAVDTALKLARAAQAQAGHLEKTLVSRTNGYHGTAYGGTSAQGFPEYREGWGELVPGHIHVPGDDVEALAQCSPSGVQRSLR